MPIIMATVDTDKDNLNHNVSSDEEEFCEAADWDEVWDHVGFEYPQLGVPEFSKFGLFSIHFENNIFIK